jgi:hypothetical protein
MEDGSKEDFLIDEKVASILATSEELEQQALPPVDRKFSLLRLSVCPLGPWTASPHREKTKFQQEGSFLEIAVSERITNVAADCCRWNALSPSTRQRGSAAACDACRLGWTLLGWDWSLRHCSSAVAPVEGRKRNTESSHNPSGMCEASASLP